MSARGATAVGILVVGLLLGGGGFLNGDAAAYAAQGWAGDATSRPVHLLWCALSVGLAPWVGTALPRVLDGVVALVAAAWVGLGRPRGSGAWLSAAFVLPWCAFAEVDVPWMALVYAAAFGRGSAVLAALAVAISPTACLALPWACRQRGSVAPLLGGLASVLVLSLVSGGEWWVGHRGVLHSELLVGRSLAAWGSSLVWLPMAAAVGVGDRRVLWLAPLVFAPPDVPAWVLAGVVSASSWPRVPVAARWRAVVAVVAVVVGVAALGSRHQRVRGEHRALEALATAHRAGDGYEGPWSWGIRLSVVASGEEGAVPFRPMRPLADGRWPAPAMQRVGLLPPGRPPAPGRHALGVDANGVHWVAPWWTPTR